MKIGFIHNFEPARQGYFAVWMFFPELDQCFAGDNVHKVILSQFEISSKLSVVFYKITEYSSLVGSEKPSRQDLMLE